MNKSYQKLIDGNRRFAMSKKFEDPEYFKKLSLGSPTQSVQELRGAIGFSRVKIVENIRDGSGLN